MRVSDEFERAGDGLPAGMLLREVPQRADGPADAVLPVRQGFAEFLEPVRRLRRSLPVGGVQRLLQMLQGGPTVQHPGRAWEGILAKTPIVGCPVGDEHNLKVQTKTETVLRFCKHIPLTAGAASDSHHTARRYGASQPVLRGQKGGECAPCNEKDERYRR